MVYFFDMLNRRDGTPRGRCIPKYVPDPELDIQKDVHIIRTHQHNENNHCGETNNLVFASRIDVSKTADR
jgi:hypothetical protein